MRSVISYFRGGFCFLLLSVVLFSCRSTKPGTDDSHAILLDTMQITVPQDNPYRASVTRVFDLEHTKLEVNFDWAHQWMYGQAYVTIRPHFYPQSSVKLDAKNMDVYKVELVKSDNTKAPLKYVYDSTKLDIKLDREYEAGEKITLYIDYKARPNEQRSGGSDAIQDDKGLYFINPLGKDTDKPREIWTQGETESNSHWFPTFDHPNFKCTDEIYITVDNKYTTLSNGILVSQKANNNGTRTDYWRMDLPHSTYLFMMAIGEFVITKDKWRDKEVNYYAEPKYAPYSKKIFGETPAMMEFFSQKLGVDYPWQKYAQVVVRDYVSGAMENTSATLHGENLNRTPRQMLDEDYHDYISHELFHQWFGDLVTCESWANTTLNESFADYSEYLWNEHKYGREYADWKNYQAYEKYLGDAKRGKNFNLVRFHYDDREAVFDATTYEKGGRILHMLRYAVGDDAFFKSLRLYLKNNEFKATEVPQLRMAFEEVTGRDMNWFFNQWYYNSGHPVLDFQYSYANDSVYVKVSQRHNTEEPLTYELPFRIDMYYPNSVVSNNVTLTKKRQTFAFPSRSKPELIDADGERVLLCEKTENKSAAEYMYQYHNVTGYMHRREALDSLKKQQRVNYDAMLLYRAALHDRFSNIRTHAIRNISVTANNRDTVLALLKTVYETDSVSQVRSAVMDAYGRQKATDYIPTVVKALGDSSYLVASTALTVLNMLDSAEALERAKLFNKETVFEMKNAVYTVNSLSGDSTYDSYFVRKLREDRGFSRSFLMYHYANFLIRMSPEMADKGIENLKTTLTDNKEQNKQLVSFGVGAIERVKDHYEREKTIYESILNSDKKVKGRYDLVKIKSDLLMMNQIIVHAKEAVEVVKKLTDKE